MNPKPLNPKPLNPKPLNPKTLFFRVDDEASAKHTSLCVEVILLYSWLGEASCTVSPDHCCMLRCVLAESRKASWEIYEL